MAASWSWGSALWTALWLALTLAAPAIKARLEKRPVAVQFWIEELLPWLLGLAPAFGAWVLGLVPGRMLGFTGRGGPVGWLLLALVLLALWLLYWRVLLPRTDIELPPLRPEHALLAEPRWAYYRAAAWLWLGNFGWGMLLGLALCLLEWAVEQRPWLPGKRQDPEACYQLAIRATSTLAFSLSANLWLTMIFQAALLWPLLPEQAGEAG
jgi:hypothetical protein